MYFAIRCYFPVNRFSTVSIGSAETAALSGMGEKIAGGNCASQRKVPVFCRKNREFRQSWVVDRLSSKPYSPVSGGVTCPGLFLGCYSPGCGRFDCPNRTKMSVFMARFESPNTDAMRNPNMLRSVYRLQPLPMWEFRLRFNISSWRITLSPNSSRR